MKCKECETEITKYRVVGVYDQFVFPPDDLREESGMNTYFYVGGTFIPLAMTLCPGCGNVKLWDLNAKNIKALKLDKSKKAVYEKKVSDG